jgi:hypothetical protein
MRRHRRKPTPKKLAERVGFEPTVRIDRTTAFEFYDSHAGACHAVVNRALWFGNLPAMIAFGDAWCRAVTHNWFAIWFANSLDQPMSAFEVKSDIPDPHAHVR